MSTAGIASLHTPTAHYLPSCRMYRICGIVSNDGHRGSADEEGSGMATAKEPGAICGYVAAKACHVCLRCAKYTASIVMKGHETIGTRLGVL